MTVYLDHPRWPAHGTVYAHLASDESVDELHALARAAGIPPRAFDGDHYDVDQGRWPAAVAAGAVVTSSAELTRRLIASGLRLRKRKGDRGLARLRGVRVAGGPSDVDVPGGFADVDVVASARPAPEAGTVGALLFAIDAGGRLLLTRSVRSREWDVPGGWRQPGETPRATAVREIWEQAGVRVGVGGLVPFGWLRITPLTPIDGIDPAQGYLQAYRSVLPDAQCPTTRDTGWDAVEWAAPDTVRTRCAGRYWWPLGALAITASA